MNSTTLDAEIALSRAGHLAASMGLPMPPDAPDDYRRGYQNFRPDDGERFGLAVAEYARIEGQLRADGLLPDRRGEDRRQPTQDVEPGWERAMWLAVAFVAGLAMPGIVDGLRALGGGA